MYNRKNSKVFSQVFCKINLLLNIEDSVIVAIDGNSGAGKSTLAYLIEKAYDCNVFHMDDYFLRPELKTLERCNEIGGNIDYLRFEHDVIDGIHSGKEFQTQKYNCCKNILEPPLVINQKKLNIVEGCYSMHPSLTKNYDLKIFISIDKDLQNKRILERNGLMIYRRFIEEWIPLEYIYFNEMNIKEQCDLVYSNLINII